MTLSRNISFVKKRSTDFLKAVLKLFAAGTSSCTPSIAFMICGSSTFRRVQRNTKPIIPTPISTENTWVRVSASMWVLPRKKFVEFNFKTRNKYLSRHKDSKAKIFRGTGVNNKFNYLRKQKTQISCQRTCSSATLPKRLHYFWKYLSRHCIATNTLLGLEIKYFSVFNNFKLY